MSFKKTATLLLSLLLFSAITIIGCDEGLTYSMPDKLIRPLEGRIVFYIETCPENGHWDFDVSGKPVLLLFAWPDQKYPAPDCPIIYNMEFDEINKIIDIDIRGVQIPTDSLDSECRYFSEFEHYMDIENGQYTLKISQRGLIDRFTLTVTDSSYRSIPNSNNQLLTSSDCIRFRAPENSFALYSYGYDPEYADVFEQSSVIINEILDFEEFYLPSWGFGLDPYEVYRFGNMGRYYLYETEDEMLDMVERLKAAHEEALGTNPPGACMITTWKREHYTIF
jgi:hypothetical protein